MPSFGLPGGMGGGQVGSLFVDFIGNNKQLLATAEESQAAVATTEGKIAASSAGMGTAMKVGLGIGALAFTQFVVGGFKSLANWQKINAQTAAAVKSTGGAANVTAQEVHDYAQQLEAATSVQAETIQTGANLLLTFTQIRNEVGKGNDIFNQATHAVLEMSVALGEDTSTAAIQLGKALNDPIRGVTALRRVGVSFTTAQQEQIKTLVETNHTLDAQKLILHELNTEFGGSAEALKGTVGGAWQSFLNTVGDMQERFVRDLLPAGKDVLVWLQGLTQALVPVAGAAADVVVAGAKIVGFLGKINPLLPVVAGGLLWINRALIADAISLRAMPVALATTEAGFWGVSTSATAAGDATAAAALKAKSFGLIVVGAAIAGANAVTQLRKALATSNDDLARELQVPADKIAAIREQMRGFFNRGALGWLNPFGSAAATTINQTREAVEAYQKVLREGAQAGLTDAEIQDRLNAGWDAAVGVLGGSSGGVDKFSASLEHSLGIKTREVAGTNVWIQANGRAAASIGDVTDQLHGAAAALNSTSTAVTSLDVQVAQWFAHLGADAPRMGAHLSGLASMTGQTMADLRAGITTALDGSQQDWTDWVAGTKAKLADWRAGVAASMNFVAGSMQGLASQAHLSAGDIVKEFDKQLVNMAHYRSAWDEVMASGIAGAKDFLMNGMLPMGEQGKAILIALAQGSHEQMAHVIGDFEAGKGGAMTFAEHLQTQLIGALDDLVQAIKGIPGWFMRVDTANARTAIDETWSDAVKKGFVFVKHEGGWIDGVGAEANRELAGDEVPVIAKRGEFVVDDRTAKRHKALLESLPRFHAGGWVGANEEVDLAGGAVGRMGTAWRNTGRHVDAAVDANLKLGPGWEHFVGGGSFAGAGTFRGGWDGHGSPNAQRYRAQVQQAWPGLRFGGMYNRRFIRGTQTWSQHAYGNAIDEMTPSLGYGDQVAAWAKARSASLHIAHLLWRVQDHFNHIHADFWPQGVGTPLALGGEGIFDHPTLLKMVVGDRGVRERVSVMPEGRLGPLGGSRSAAGGMGGPEVLAELVALRRAVEKLELEVNVEAVYDSRRAGMATTRRALLKR